MWSLKAEKSKTSLERVREIRGSDVWTWKSIGGSVSDSFAGQATYMVLVYPSASTEAAPISVGGYGYDAELVQQEAARLCEWLNGDMAQKYCPPPKGLNYPVINLGITSRGAKLGLSSLFVDEAVPARVVAAMKERGVTNPRSGIRYVVYGNEILSHTDTGEWRDPIPATVESLSQIPDTATAAALRRQLDHA